MDLLVSVKVAANLQVRDLWALCAALTKYHQILLKGTFEILPLVNFHWSNSPVSDVRASIKVAVKLFFFLILMKVI